MARKKQTTVLERLESPDCALFTLPGELRNTIYELVFENGNETMSVADFASAPVKFGWNPELPSSRPVEHTSTADVDAVPTNAGPPSSALVRTCQKIRDETEGIFAAAYQRFWQKSFVFDLRGVSLLDRYMDCVPMAWIRSYIFIVDMGPNSSPAEVTLSRFWGEWGANATTDHVPEADNSQAGFRSNLYPILLEAYDQFLWFNSHLLYAKPQKWCKMKERTKLKKRANKKFTRKDNKAKTKSKRVLSKAFKAWKKRPKTAMDVHGAPRATSPMSAPLTMEALLSIVDFEMSHNLREQLSYYEHSAYTTEDYWPYTDSRLSRWMANEVGI
jgi:hypothetical protein